MSKTTLMAILNATPDSFFKESCAPSLENAIAKALQMQKEGADILDIGAESSRPGAESVSVNEELSRIIPLLDNLKDKLTIPLSIDTVKPEVAEVALQRGATLINDISALSDPKMVKLALEYQAEVCLMHMHGTPRTMQINPVYPEGVIHHLLHWFEHRAARLISFGINPKKIIIDPGIGFGKTVADNLKILQNLPLFKRLGFRVLLGVSRKSFMSKIINKPPEELLPTTLAINTLAILSGVDIIRVHDVKEHRSVIDLMNVYQS